jgi:menaquinol-cytochrome c reductase iron-sulfur subunit
MSDTASFGGQAPSPPGLPETARREFMKWAISILSLFVALGIGIPFINTFVGPILRKKKPSWAKATSLDSMPIGQPVSLTFASLNVDAYVRESVLHSVWAIKRSDSEVTVYSSTCPHLGCHYNWNPQTNHFECPCHSSVYAMDGKVMSGPAPRSLDTLPVKIEGGSLYVEWGEFKIGIPQKVPA